MVMVTSATVGGQVESAVERDARERAAVAVVDVPTSVAPLVKASVPPSIVPPSRT